MADEETTTTVENVDEPTQVDSPETTEEVGNTSTEDAESEAAETAEAEPEKEKPKLDLKQRKIAKQARELREMKRQNAQLARAIEEQSKAVTRSQKPSEPPKIEDFEDIASYLDARDEYRDSQRETKAEKPVKSDNFTNPKDELSDMGSEKYDDFDDVVFSEDIKISKEMAAAIFEIEDGDVQVDVAYYLGNNPKEAAKIAKLSERRQIAEIGKLELKIANKPKAVKKASKAPAPIKPVGGTKTANDEIQEVESYESFLKKRHKQLGR